jgi:hypothetical protein
MLVSRPLSRIRRTLDLFGLLVLPGLLASAAPAAAQHFDQIALEFVDGLGFLDTSVQPDLSNTGRVVFAGDEAGTGDDHLFAGSGDGLERVDLSSFGFSNLENVEVDNAGNVAWTSDRLTSGVTYRGVYRTRLDPPFPGIYSRLTIYQGRLFPYDALQPPARRHIALTSHGELLYSSLTNGDGGLYKGPILGTKSLYQDGSGIYYNNIQLDLNEAGEVTAQLEYSDPILNLSRGIFVWDAPLQLRDDARTAVEKLGVATQYAPDLNNAGQVAFVVGANATMTFYDPPNDGGGAIVAQIQLTPGIWLATPTPFGEPPILTQLVDTSTGFSSFGQVLLDDFGRVVFSASKAAGGSGIYRGPDPVADKLVEVGDIVDGRLFSFLALGKGNDWGQFALITSDFFTTDRQVWRVTPEPVPEPGTAVLLSGGTMLLAVFARRRR